MQAPCKCSLLAPCHSDWWRGFMVSAPCHLILSPSVFLRLYHPNLTRSISFLPLALFSPKFPLYSLFRATSTFLDLPFTPHFLSPSGDCIVPVLLPCMEARAPSEHCSPCLWVGRFLSQTARLIHPCPPISPVVCALLSTAPVECDAMRCICVSGRPAGRLEEAAGRHRVDEAEGRAAGVVRHGRGEAGEWGMETDG